MLSMDIVHGSPVCSCPCILDYVHVFQAFPWNFYGKAWNPWKNETCPWTFYNRVHCTDILHKADLIIAIVTKVSEVARGPFVLSK